MMVTPHDLVGVLGDSDDRETHQGRLGQIEPLLPILLNDNLQPLVLFTR